MHGSHHVCSRPATRSAPPRGRGVLLALALVVSLLGSSLFAASASAGEAPTDVVFVRMTFEWGDQSETLDLQLFSSSAPKTVDNFLRQRDGYANSVLHRLVRGFVLQGGGFTFGADYPEIQQVCACEGGEEGGEQTGCEGEGEGEGEAQGGGAGETPSEECPVQDEYGADRPNTCGTIAMAKTGAPDTATTQWYFNLEDNTIALGPANEASGFTVFGQVAQCESPDDPATCQVVEEGKVGSCVAAAAFLQPLATMASLPTFDRPGTCPGPMLPAPSTDDTCVADPTLDEACQGCPEPGSIASSVSTLPLTGYSTEDYFSYAPVAEANHLILRSVVIVPEPAGVVPAALAVACVLLLARRGATRPRSGHLARARG